MLTLSSTYLLSFYVFKESKQVIYYSKVLALILFIYILFDSIKQTWKHRKELIQMYKEFKLSNDLDPLQNEDKVNSEEEKENDTSTKPNN